MSLFSPRKLPLRAPPLFRHPDLSQIENVRKINPGRRQARAIDFCISNVSGLAEFLRWSACLWGRAAVPACRQPVHSLQRLFLPHSPQTPDLLAGAAGTKHWWEYTAFLLSWESLINCFFPLFEQTVFIILLGPPELHSKPMMNISKKAPSSTWIPSVEKPCVSCCPEFQINFLNMREFPPVVDTNVYCSLHTLTNNPSVPFNSGTVW